MMEYDPPKLKELFEAEHERLMKSVDRSHKVEAMKQGAIDWLVAHGVPIELIQRLLDSGKLELATIEEAKREFLRLIDLLDKWDGVDLDFLIDELKEDFKKTGNIERLQDRIRVILRSNFKNFTEDELKKLVELKFGKQFKFEWVRSYTKKNEKVVDTYVRIQFKQ